MTSSTKPEVHNVSQRRSGEIRADRQKQTDRQTDTHIDALITIPRSTNGAEYTSDSAPALLVLVLISSGKDVSNNQAAGTSHAFVVAAIRCLPLSSPLRENVTSSKKPELHNISLQSRVEPRPQKNMRQKLVKIGHVVPEIFWRTNRHTHRRCGHYNTPLGVTR